MKIFQLSNNAQKIKKNSNHNCNNQKIHCHKKPNKNDTWDKENKLNKHRQQKVGKVSLSSSKPGNISDFSKLFEAQVKGLQNSRKFLIELLN